MNMEYLVDTCLQYGITEDIMNQYIYNEMMLLESTDVTANDVNYFNYVQRCKKSGVEPMSEEKYKRKRRKIIKGLKIAAATAGGLLATHELVRHTKKGYKAEMKVRNGYRHHMRKVAGRRKNIKQHQALNNILDTARKVLP